MASRTSSNKQASCSASLEEQMAPAIASQGKKGHRSINLTMYGANSWQANFSQSGKTILVDPWLVGKLTFADQNWLFEGSKGFQQDLDVDAIAAGADLLLLSQGLPDHAHKPTLQRLPKEMPVVCSPAAARVVADMGFKNVFELDHGQSMTFCNGAVQIHATIGALVGPPWSKRENGFVISETCRNGVKIYYEPHCDYDQQSLESVKDIDLMITPAVSQVLLAYPLVQGASNIVKLIKQLKPKVVVPLENSAFPMKGPLSSIISKVDSEDTLPARLQDAHVTDVQVQLPPAAPESLTVNIP